MQIYAIGPPSPTAVALMHLVKCQPLSQTHFNGIYRFSYVKKLIFFFFLWLQNVQFYSISHWLGFCSSHSTTASIFPALNQVLQCLMTLSERAEPVLEPEVLAAGPAVRTKQINHVKDKTTSPLSTTKTIYLFTSRPHIHAHTYVQYWYEDWPQTCLNFIFINAAMLRYASDSQELCKKAWHRAVVQRRKWYTYSVEDFPQDYSLVFVDNKCLRIKGNENRKQIQPICLQMASNRVTMLQDCPLFLADFIAMAVEDETDNLHSQTRLNTQNKEIKFPLK